MKNNKEKGKIELVGKNLKESILSILQRKGVLYIEILLALIPLTALFNDFRLDHEHQKETAVRIETNHKLSQIDVCLSNDDLVAKKIVMRYLKNNDVIGTIVCTERMSSKAFQERISKEGVCDRLTSLNSNSLINEWLWFPVIIDVDYFGKTSNVIHGKFLFKVNCLLVDYKKNDPKSFLYYSVFNFQYVKKLPSYCSDERQLKKYYRKSKKEFLKTRQPADEVLYDVQLFQSQPDPVKIE